MCLLTDSDEEVDHEADVEGEVDLLAGVLVVRNAVLHSFPAPTNCQHSCHGKVYIISSRSAKDWNRLLDLPPP